MTRITACFTLRACSAFRIRFDSVTFSFALPLLFSAFRVAVSLAPAYLLLHFHLALGR